MQIDLINVTTRLLAVLVLVVAIACIIMVWMAATGNPAFHIPWVVPHEAATH
jgi:hypothetical protein